MDQRFCWNCYNFEDRRDIDGVVLCARGHTPGTTCEEFVEKEDEMMEVGLDGHFCWNCCNFEDRRGIDGVTLCAKGRYPEGNCDEFANNNLHEGALVKTIIMEDKDPMNQGISVQNPPLEWKNSHERRFVKFNRRKV